MTLHKHTAHSVSEPRCFRGSVNPRDEWRPAHGNIEVTETCGCGHARRVNINGRFREEGPWTVPAPPLHVTAARRLFNGTGRAVLGHGVVVRANRIVREHGLVPSDTVRVCITGQPDSSATVAELLQAACEWAGEGNAADHLYGLIAGALRPCVAGGAL